MSDIKQFLADNLFRGSYSTAEETEMDSPLQFLLWLANRQIERMAKPTNHDAIQSAVTGE